MAVLLVDIGNTRIKWARFVATIPDDPEEETWWCAPTATRRNGRFLQEAELRGEVWE